MFHSMGKRQCPEPGTNFYRSASLIRACRMRVILLVLLAGACLLQSTARDLRAATDDVVCHIMCDLNYIFCGFGCSGLHLTPAQQKQCYYDCGVVKDDCHRNCDWEPEPPCPVPYVTSAYQVQVDFTPGDTVVPGFGRRDSDWLLLTGQGGVTGVDFAIIDLMQIDTARALDSSDFAPLGAGTFNPATSLWEYEWNTSAYVGANVWVIRARFHDPSGCAEYDEAYLGALCSQEAYGDVNGDGVAFGFADAILLNRVLSGEASPPPSIYQGDLNGNCVIDTGDAGLFSCYFVYGMSCFEEYPVPTCCAPRICACNCNADPAPLGTCDGVQDVTDVVAVVNVAFRGAATMPDPNANCPNERTDTNCSGSTDVVDVVKMVNVAFRGADPATEYCNPCP